MWGGTVASILLLSWSILSVSLPEAVRSGSRSHRKEHRHRCCEAHGFSTSFQAAGSGCQRKNLRKLRAISASSSYRTLKVPDGRI